MSDSTVQPARPVSLFTIFFVLALFAAFLLVVRFFYAPTQTLPRNFEAENIPAEAAWRATPETRRKTRIEQQEAATSQISSYAWADQAAGRIQLPIERAMELTVQHYGERK